ncbi:gamma-glutamyltransferase [Zymobacter palmae]|uniref:Gamma-glutamyltransferase n=1 Tax=Zymobacter palmae TaxID=33074 RepID=A0A348HC48_9GAMM|nr:gamma-glutamyltransferase [Zymobacter palmae]
MLLAEVVHLFKQRVELIDRVDAIGLAPRFLPPRPPDRGFQRVVGIGVCFDQIEFDFRRDHRLPAALFIQRQHSLKHMTRRQFHCLAVHIAAVMDHLSRRLFGPRHQIGRMRIGHQLHIQLGEVPEAQMLVLGIIPGDRLDKHRVRQARPPSAQVFVGGHNLALQYAGNIADQAFHFRNAVLAYPSIQLLVARIIDGSGIRDCHVNPRSLFISVPPDSVSAIRGAHTIVDRQDLRSMKDRPLRTSPTLARRSARAHLIPYFLKHRQLLALLHRQQFQTLHLVISRQRRRFAQCGIEQRHSSLVGRGIPRPVGQASAVLGLQHEVDEFVGQCGMRCVGWNHHAVDPHFAALFGNDIAQILETLRIGLLGIEEIAVVADSDFIHPSCQHRQYRRAIDEAGKIGALLGLEQQLARFGPSLRRVATATVVLPGTRRSDHDTAIVLQRERLARVLLRIE